MSNTNVLHSYIWIMILCFTFLCSFFIPVYYYFFILYIISVKVKKTIACSIRGDLLCYLQGIFSAQPSSSLQKSYSYSVFLSCFSENKKKIFNQDTWKAKWLKKKHENEVSLRLKQDQISASGLKGKTRLFFLIFVLVLSTNTLNIHDFFSVKVILLLQ